MSDLLDLVVVEVEEDETRQGDQVLNLGNVVVLEVKQAEALFSFKERHVRQLPFVEVQPFRIRIAFGGLPVHYKDSRDLRQFSKYDLVFILHSPHDSVLQQVPVPLIFLVLSKL